jgi:hypothetical protein
MLFLRVFSLLFRYSYLVCFYLHSLFVSLSYHFDLIETLTSLPATRAHQTRGRRRERGLSISSQECGAGLDTKDSNSSGTNLTQEQVEGGKDAGEAASSNPNEGSCNKHYCCCGVVSLLECIPSGGGGAQTDRTSKRTLRSKHREFNSRAQLSWGRGNKGSGGGGKRQGKLRSIGSSVGGGGSGTVSGGVRRFCHQPRHLPLPLNPHTRVTFAYELTSIAVVVDASPSLTATFGSDDMFADDDYGEEKSSKLDQLGSMCCVPLDRLAVLLKTYLKGLIQPIEVPPVAVSGLGIAFGRWTPNLAITVVAAYPPTSRGVRASAGLLVRDFRVTDEQSALELVRQVERWALREVEGLIAERMSGDRDFSGDGVAGRSKGKGGYHQSSPLLTPLDSFSLPYSQPMGAFSSVKSSMKDIFAVGDAALATLPPEGRPVILVATDCRNVQCGGVFEHLAETSRSDVPISVLDLSTQTTSNNSSFPLSISDDSQSLRDACQRSGGMFLHSTLLEESIKTIAGTQINPTSPIYGDFHFSFKKRSIRPNALQWYSLFILSPFTPFAGPSLARPMGTPLSTDYRSSSLLFTSTGSSTKHHQTHDTSSFSFSGKQLPGNATALQERTVFSKYNINPVRIKSLLMTRVLEGYRARRYGHNTQDSDKVSMHMTLKLSDCGVVLHYEVSFVSSPYHIPTVGTAHIKLELSGDDDFIAIVKKRFISQHGTDNLMMQGRRVPAISKAAADKICKLLRWIRKEDYLDSYLCLPG